MNKPELQTRILASSVKLFTLASAIDALPDSETRGELIYRHDHILEDLANLQANLGDIDRNICYFALTNKCPGGTCAECEHLIGG